MKILGLLAFVSFNLPAFAEIEIPDYGRPNRAAVGSRQKALEKCQREHPGTNCLDAISASTEAARPPDAGRPGLIGNYKRQRLIKECLKSNTQAYCLDLYMAGKTITPARLRTATLKTEAGSGDAGQ